MALYLDNSTVIQYVLTNPLEDPIYVNDATVTVTIYDSDDVELTGVAWPQTLDYVSGSDGLYRKTFDPFDDLIENERYEVVISSTGSDSLEGECRSKELALEKYC